MLSLKKYFLLLLVVILFLPNTNLWALTTVLRDFNNTDDLNTYFNSDGSPQFTNVSSGGLSDTGAIDVPLGSTDVLTTKQGYSVSGEGDVYTFSAYFKIKANSGYGGLGFSSADTNSGDMQGSPVTGIGMSFHGGGGSFVNNRVYTDVSWPPDLVLGNWYKMILKVTAKGSNTYDLLFQIWNSDAGGVLGTKKTEHALNGVVNASLGGSSVIYGYFSAAGSRMEKIDDFEITLEGNAGFVESGTPVVFTDEVTQITHNSATAGGNVSDDRGAEVTTRGVCWSTSSSPTTSNQCSNDGAGVGTFTSSVTGLVSSTTYYLRAFATNSNGTTYGTEQIFTTEEAPVVIPDEPQETLVQHSSIPGGSSIRSRVSKLFSAGNSVNALDLMKEWPHLFSDGYIVTQTNALESNQSIPVRDLEYGMAGQDVSMLQTLLISQGYTIPAGATGFFGNQTRTALSNYQKDNKVSPSVGYFGPITRSQMKAVGLIGLWW
jgi:hypothetical protein